MAKAKPRRVEPTPLEPIDDLFATAVPPIIPKEMTDADDDSPSVRGSSIAKLLAVIKEIAVRRAEALALYEPLPSQMVFHQCTAQERLLRGSVRCLAGEQLIHDPIAGTRRVDEIDRAFHVLARNPKSGQMEIKKACRPFVKGYGELFEYSLSNGRTIKTTQGHLVLSADHQWTAIEQAFSCTTMLICAPQKGFLLCHQPFGSYEELANAEYHRSTQFEQRTAEYTGRSIPRRSEEEQHGHRKDALPATSIAANSLVDCRLSLRSYDERFLSEEDICQAWTPLSPDAQGCNRSHGNADVRALAQERIHSCRLTAQSRSLSALAEYRIPSLLSEGSSLKCEALCKRPKPSSSHEDKDARQSLSSDQISAWGSPVFVISRRPLGVGPIWDFSVDDFENYACAGIVSHNSGKTLPAGVEVARALTGTDPYGKYPLRDGICYMVSPNEAHIRDVIFPKLFKAGAFRMIRDKETKLWRSYRPLDPEDQGHIHETKPCPPLITARFIKDIAWRDKKGGIPSTISMKNGWQISFFVEKGTPQRGVAVDLVWFDEEIAGGSWYSEMSSRLLDREGKFIWSAAPQTGTQQLYELHRRAEEQLARPPDRRTIIEFHVVLRDNPHINPLQKKMLAEKLTEDEARILIDGEYAILSYLVYPMFSKEKHGIQSFDIPTNWTHYAIIDPGHQVCAVLFVVAPPPDHELGKHRIAYDELYLKQCSADMFAEAASPKITGRNFEGFIIDRKMTQQADIGTGKSLEMQYMEALQRRNLACNVSGHGFIWGSMDVRGRLSQSRSWLEPKHNGRPTFLYFKDILRFLVWEFERYHNKTIGKDKVLTDDPVRVNDHLMATVQYAAAHGCEYVPPPVGEPAPGGALALFNRWQAEANRKQGGQYIRLGPGKPE